jgi:hypothetical protein
MTGMADFPDYKVPKVNESVSARPMNPAKSKGGAVDALMKNPPPKGAATNPGASPDPHFGREFSAEKDFQTLMAASKIRANAARYGAAVKAGKSKLAKEASGRERKAAISTDKIVASGGPVGERKGPNNQGVRTKAVNKFDNVKGAGKPNSGTKMDGQKGRW